MNPQKFISSLYPSSRILNGIEELKAFKRSESICIMGNGPSAFYFLDQLGPRESIYDISGTSAASLQNHHVNYYFYEPHFCINHQGSKLSTAESVSHYALHRILHHEWTAAVSVKNCSVVIPNPQIPPNTFGYSEIIEHPEVLIPPWVFINEADDFSIIRGLRDYFTSNLYEAYILNFRASIVRQISLAIGLGYQNIYISGLDPSTIGYWYTDEIIRKNHIELDVERRCMQVFNSYGLALKLCQKISPGESALAGPIATYFEFTKSILFSLRLFCRSNQSVLVHLLAKDKIVNSICEELEMNKLRNCLIIF